MNHFNTSLVLFAVFLPIAASLQAQDDPASKLADIVITEEQFEDLYTRYPKIPSETSVTTRDIAGTHRMSPSLFKVAHVSVC